MGSTGRILPAIEHRIEAVDGLSEGGRLLVRGPNVMKGYLNAEVNAKFREMDGWYDTGDLARVDTDGYLYLLGRLKRFAKIGGEMVSLPAVEEALVEAFPQHGRDVELAIVSRPDPDRGEALVAVTNHPQLQMDEIRAVLRTRGLSNLCLPKELIHVEEIPRLPTGKVDYQGLAKKCVQK
jgi:acyl-[acyl-carrier-protein]-phospholipid O-acyltransferase/long-chain-fatty-acid--[acyl-carrier-protein] ligase